MVADGNIKTGLNESLEHHSLNFLKTLSNEAVGRKRRSPRWKRRHLQQAGHNIIRLPPGQHEQDLGRKTESRRGIREHDSTLGTAAMRRKPSHPHVQLDQRLAAARRATADGGWLARAPRLTTWIHVMNPPRDDLFNNAQSNLTSVQPARLPATGA